jgi:hypothetical protein
VFEPFDASYFQKNVVFGEQFFGGQNEEYDAV